MIDVRDLRFSYAKANAAALFGLDFAVERGEIFGFLGPSGAGKSTTQKILIGLLEGYTGEVCVCGKEVAAWRPADYERIGVSFETPNHFLKLTSLQLVVTSIVAAPLAPIYALFLGTFATNKVQDSR